MKALEWRIGQFSKGTALSTEKRTRETTVTSATTAKTAAAAAAAITATTAEHFAQVPLRAQLPHSQI